jgi:hypothetical protein
VREWKGPTLPPDGRRESIANGRGREGWSLEIDGDELDDEPRVDLVASVVGTVERHDSVAAVGRRELRMIDGEPLAVNGNQSERSEWSRAQLATEFGEGHARNSE